MNYGEKRVMKRGSVKVNIETSVRVNPVLELVTIIARRIFWSARTSGQSISSSMLLCGNMDELEVKQEDSRYPAVHGVVRMQGGGVDHALDELRVHLYNQLLHTDGEDLSVLESTEEAIELELSLGVARLAIVKGDRTKPAGIALPILSDLEENVPDAVCARVDSEDNWSVGLVLDGAQGRRGEDGVRATLPQQLPVH
jgi:hypothetical protein